MSIDNSYHCITVVFVPLSPGLVRSHACALDQFGKAGGCSDICLLSNSHKTRTCRCRSGFSLGSDGKSCKSEYQIFYLNLINLKFNLTKTNH